jgi:mediator of RNA polymerase II transcription subunit 4
MLQITKLIVQKQNELNNFLNLASRQQILYQKINKLKGELIDSDSNIKKLLIYLKEAEQILSSAVYQSKLKLNMIKKAKPLPADLIVCYAHKISSDYGVCCPENWVPENPKRPYPTDADMRRGWLSQISNMITDGTINKLEVDESNSNQESKSDLFRSNSKSMFFSLLF